MKCCGGMYCKCNMYVENSVRRYVLKLENVDNIHWFMSKCKAANHRLILRMTSHSTYFECVSSAMDNRINYANCNLIIKLQVIQLKVEQ